MIWWRGGDFICAPCTHWCVPRERERETACVYSRHGLRVCQGLLINNVTYEVRSRVLDKVVSLCGGGGVRSAPFISRQYVIPALRLYVSKLALVKSPIFYAVTVHSSISLIIVN